MNERKELIKRYFERRGCSPTWSFHYRDYCCSCRGNDHGFDQQGSMLADPSERELHTILRKGGSHHSITTKGEYIKALEIVELIETGKFERRLKRVK